MYFFLRGKGEDLKFFTVLISHATSYSGKYNCIAFSYILYGEYSPIGMWQPHSPPRMYTPDSIG